MTAIAPETPAYGIPTGIPTGSEQDVDQSHDWVVAANIPVDPRSARFADQKNYLNLKTGQRIRAIEVYCARCRMSMDGVDDELTCSALVNNHHLIGGDQTTRKRRKVFPRPPGARVVQGPAIIRRGIDGLMEPTHTFPRPARPHE